MQVRKPTRCGLTPALSGPHEAHTMRRERDNFSRARGAPLPSLHGPLQRMVRDQLESVLCVDDAGCVLCTVSRASITSVSVTRS